MADQPRYRTLPETDEYTAQYDALVSRYSDEVVTPPLLGLLWGIATNPQEYSRVTAHIYKAQSRSLGLTIPIFVIYFEILNKGTDEEQVLLLWIEEMKTTEEIGELL